MFIYEIIHDVTEKFRLSRGFELICKTNSLNMIKKITPIIIIETLTNFL